jgi:hypothetical protein
LAPLLEGLAQKRALADRVETALAEPLQGEDFAIDEVVKSNAKGAVFFANWQGQGIVVKQFIGPDCGRTVGRLEAELATLSAHMNDGLYQVNQCLRAFADLGIVFLSRAPGQRLSKTIKQASGDAREVLFRHAGRWAAQYAQGCQQVSAFAPRRWIHKLEAFDISSVTNGSDRALLRRLKEIQVARADAISGADVTRAASPADFVGINLNYHDGVIYGFDIQGESIFPLARAIARFLVWQQMEHAAPTDKTVAGIREADYFAMVSSEVLPEKEVEALLPFLIAVETYRRFVSTDFNSTSLFRLRNMIEAMVAE